MKTEGKNTELSMQRDRELLDLMMTGGKINRILAKYKS